MLRVAVGEHDAVPLLVQPGGQVNGERRFAHAALGICDHDNHAADTTPLAGMLASIMCITSTRNHPGKQAIRVALKLADWQRRQTVRSSANKAVCRTVGKHAGRMPCRTDCLQAGRKVGKHAGRKAGFPDRRKAGRQTYPAAGSFSQSAGLGVVLSQGKDADFPALAVLREDA